MMTNIHTQDLNHNRFVRDSDTVESRTSIKPRT
jgi:hypothetical protein